jgi:hypothetical protein
LQTLTENWGPNDSDANFLTYFDASRRSAGCFIKLWYVKLILRKLKTTTTNMKKSCGNFSWFYSSSQTKAYKRIYKMGVNYIETHFFSRRNNFNFTRREIIKSSTY